MNRINEFWCPADNGQHVCLGEWVTNNDDIIINEENYDIIRTDCLRQAALSQT